MAQQHLKKRLSAGVYRAAHTLRRVAALVFAATFVASCSKDIPTITGPLTTITVTPNAASVPAGRTQQFTAVGKDADGLVVGFTPVWSVAPVGGATISTTGLFTAGATAGSYTVKAVGGAIQGTVTVTVTSSSSRSITPQARR